MLIRLTDKVSGKKISVAAERIVKTHAMDDGVGTLLTHSASWCTTVLEKESQVIRMVNNALNGVMPVMKKDTED